FTLLSSSSRDISVASEGTKTEFSTMVGKREAELALSAGIETVVFDSNRYLYHARIKDLED
ncbi:50S ribosomal protein L18, partial [Ornithobacterium rhinotracheale]